MAARLWRLLVACELGAAVLFGVLAVQIFPATAAWGPVIAILVALGLPLIVLIASFFVAATSARTGLSDPGPWLRALGSEAFLFSVAVIDMLLAAPADSRSRHSEKGTRPLMLIHGIGCNGAVWKRWTPRLAALGFAPIRVMDLEPVFAGIDAHVGRVAAEIASLQQRANGAPVTLVAHSMGGLVARAAFSRVGREAVDRIITIACPHHGTRLAGCFPWKPVRQMRTGSAWLESLNSAHQPAAVKILTNIYTREDNLIIPALSASIPAAREIEMRGWGHVGILASEETAAHVIAALSAGQTVAHV